MKQPRKPRIPRVCAVCKAAPAQGVSVYRVVAGGPWLCWNHLSAEERQGVIIRVLTKRHSRYWSALPRA